MAQILVFLLTTGAIGFLAWGAWLSLREYFAGQPARTPEAAASSGSVPELGPELRRA